jgi:DNA-binding NarL/FixJ family response regulator
MESLAQVGAFLQAGSMGMALQDGIRVVLADDNREIISVVRLTLGERFHIVAAVDDGKQAVLAVLEFGPDLLITDLAMPFMDGLQVAKALQKAKCRAKIIFLTLQENPDLIAASFAAGVVGYVTKTRLSVDLDTAVEEVLKGNTFISDLAADWKRARGLLHAF